MLVQPLILDPQWLYSFRVIYGALLLEVRLLVIWGNGSLCQILRRHAADALDRGPGLKSTIIREFVLALACCSVQTLIQF